MYTVSQYDLGIWEERRHQSNTRASWCLSGKDSACQCRKHRFNPWSRTSPHAVEQLSPSTELLSLCARACCLQ